MESDIITIDRGKGGGERKGKVGSRCITQHLCT